jgi:hypothetical protein
MLLFQNPFIHNLVMLRRKILEGSGAHSEDSLVHRAFVEDYDLWSRVNLFGRCCSPRQG